MASAKPQAPLLSGIDPAQDYRNVMVFIDEFVEKLGSAAIIVDPDVVQRVVNTFTQDFPHKDGVGRASAFKLVANFVCYFVAERPIKVGFPETLVGRIAAIDNHQNALVAFAIAEAALHGSVIHRADGEITVDHPIAVSSHSYCDIVDALADAAPVTHFKMVSVLLEQLVYKSNPTCQYDLRV